MHGEKNRFHIKRSQPGLGLGLFAATSFSAREFLLEYTGKRIPTVLADKLSTRYLFEIDGQWTIDGSSKGNMARYINHACEPNCEAELHSDRILIFAKHDIMPREELTLDYGEEYFDEFIRPEGCLCTSCRGVLHVSIAA